MTESTPVANVDAAITAAGEQARLRVVAAGAARDTQKVRRVVTAGTAAKPAAKRTVGTKATITKPGKASTASAGKRSTPGSRPAPVSPKEAAVLAKESAKLQGEWVSKARDVLARTDQGNWELAKITFEATEADSFARMNKGEWAESLGVSPSLVSRWISVHREFGLPSARQKTGTGSKARELSFNDHIELTKVPDEGQRKNLIKAMQASGHSFATELRRSREATKNGTATKSKDKDVDTLAGLVNRVTADGEDRLEAFKALGEFASKALIAFRTAFEGIESADLTDGFKQVVRNVLNESTGIETTFEEKIEG